MMLVLAFIIIYFIYKLSALGLFTLPVVLLLIAYASMFPTGEMNVMFDGKTIASVPIYYENERNKKPKKSFFETFQSVFQKAAGGSSWSI